MTGGGVSIIGIGCRLPGAEGGEFRRADGEYPDDTAWFDHEWFAIPDQAAALLDPRQRMAMEVTVEAIDDAGVGYRTRGSGAAVLFGYDHSAVLGRDGFDTPHAGTALSGVATRLSAVLDLHGPSLVVDSVSSSLVAVDLAVRLLVDEAVPFAVVGGVDLPLPTSNYLAENGFRSPDCLTEPVDGEARRDACAVVIMQRTDDAVREGNRVYAELGVTSGSDVAQGISLPTEQIRNGSTASDDVYRAVGAGLIGLIEAALSIHDGASTATVGARSPQVSTVPVHSIAARPGEHAWGVGAFGNRTAHKVLRRIETPPMARGDDPPVLIPVTGRDADELSAQALRLADRLESDAEPLREIASAAARLMPEQMRACVLAGDRGDAVQRLRALAGDDPSTGVIGPSPTRRPGGLLFLFAGTGEQHLAMGRALAARHSAFSAALTRVADAIVTAGGPRVWTPRHGFAIGSTSNENGSCAFAHPAIFAFHLAMAELLATWGIRPDAVVGHGLGEIAAAAVGGALSLPDAARVVLRRSAFLSESVDGDAVALLLAPAHEVVKLVEPMRAQVSVAAINGPRSVVVSGVPRYIDTLVRRAKRRDMSALRITDESAAYPRLATVPAEFRESLADLAPMAPHTPLYSTTRRGELVDTAVLDGQYWAENASRTVDLAAALERAAAAGLSTVLELAPHPSLLSAVEEYPEFHDGAHPVATRADEAGDFLTCLARLHLEGRPVDWSAQGPFRTAPRRVWRKRRVPLPIDAETLTPVESASAPDDLADHVINGAPTVPATFWLLGLLQLTRTGGAAATMLTDFVLHERLDLAALPAVRYRRHDGSVRAEVTAAAALASARPGGDPTPAHIVAWMRVVDANRAGRHRMRVIAPAAFYAALRELRLEYGPRFRVLRGIATGPDRAIGVFDAAETRSAATLSGCLHLLGAIAFDELPTGASPLSIGIDSVWLSAEPDRVVLEAHALLRERTDTGFSGDVIGTDQHGVPCLAMSGVRIGFAQSITPAAFSGHPQGSELRAPFRQEVWESRDHFDITSSAAGHPNTLRTLVIGDSELAIRLSDALATTLPTERIAREPDAASPLITALPMSGTGSAHTAVVVVWPAETASAATLSDPIGPGRSATATTCRVLDLLQRVHADDGTGSLTVVLPEPVQRTTASGLLSTDTDALAAPQAIAGLVRSLQLESDLPVRLIWIDTDPRNVAPLSRLVAQGLSDSNRLLDEIRIRAGAFAIRRFIPAQLHPTPAATVDATGTYVVTGGLGAVGAVAVRWLLDAGARDVVVLTRAPRPVPPLLDGLEDRIVIVRCDAADRRDLANALNDIRECGSTIRGVVHAAGTATEATFDATTPGQLAELFSPKLTAAGNLIGLTSADPTDFILLFSAATGALGGPGHSAEAAANAAMDSLALAHPGRGVLSIGWGAWATGSAVPPRQAGTAAFDPRSAAALLSRALRFTGAYLLAVDYTPSADTSPMAMRLSNLLAPMADSSEHTHTAERHPPDTLGLLVDAHLGEAP
ncbi:acyltransferase domain-containing protein [Nocardia sp. XZ_19_369]|uniref:acyltransferase domain-containing protein n=1 Tax=Nocardia sp. XZ_19_369 TaxID=2769487 RepID=UPI00188DD724|nr:acyltransferase domain-containing protein [Nocardia sp. XZ_19_369]